LIAVSKNKLQINQSKINVLAYMWTQPVLRSAPSSCARFTTKKNMV